MTALLASLLVTAAPTPELLNALVEIREGARPCKELRVVYKDGNDAVGTTELRVLGRWARLIRKEPDAEKPTIYRGSVPASLCRRLLRVVTENKLWKARGKRRSGLDDETRPSIKISVKNIGGFRVSMWGFEVQNSPGFAMTRANLILIARRLSDNVVRY